MLLAVRIEDWLYQGGQPGTEQALFRLKHGGITHVLSTNAENPFVPNTMRMFGPENVLHVPWRDDALEKPVADFRRIYEWAGALPQDRVILSHCSAGINRSTLASVWLLTCFEHMAPHEAYNRVVARHVGAKGFQTPAYRESLLRALRDVLGRDVRYEPLDDSHA